MPKEKYVKREYKRGPRKREFNPEIHCGHASNDGLPCTNKKGYDTDHPGEGACKFHGGNRKPSVYTKLKSSATRDRLQDVHEMVEDPMDLLPELELLRAITLEFYDRFEEFKDGLLAFHHSFDSAISSLLATNSPLAWAKAVGALRESINQRPIEVVDISSTSVIIDRIGKMVERIHKIKTDGALTPERIKMYRDALVIAVIEECTPEQAKRIADKMARL